MMTQRGAMQGVGWGLKRKGVYVYIELIHFVCTGESKQHRKAIILQ